MPGVYLSYPFCAQKCTFCNFASDVAKRDEQERYDSALEREIREHRWTWKPETIYWGGGTPSLMNLESFAVVMSAIPSEDAVEATLECAPGTIDERKLAAWQRVGINRVSLGVQSFVAAEAQQTGRKHTAETVSADIALLRSAGISNINIDLIAGLPGQTEASWRRSLDWLERLHPPHVSVYLFELDEDSALGNEALLGGIRYGAALLPSDDAAAEFYEQAVERLAVLGLPRYEISNFAAPGWESRHNLKYWRLEPYVGFGLDAHSFDGHLRRANTDDLANYLNRIESAQPACEEISESDIGEEHFFVGLRQSAGIRPTQEEWVRFRSVIDFGVTSGLLETDGITVKLTSRGFLLSNEIFQQFLDSCSPVARVQNTRDRILFYAT
jgi:oxygen-independent coproporphyrinogen-3 oxidase